MLTEEKLQKFIDALRSGQYDSDRYEIERTYVKDLQTNTCVFIGFYKEDSIYVKKKFYIFHEYKEIKLKEPKYFININYSSIEVSKDLYKSYKDYFTEIEQKAELVQRINCEKYFDL